MNSREATCLEEGTHVCAQEMRSAPASEPKPYKMVPYKGMQAAGTLLAKDTSVPTATIPPASHST